VSRRFRGGFGGFFGGLLIAAHRDVEVQLDRQAEAFSRGAAEIAETALFLKWIEEIFLRALSGSARDDVPDPGHFSLSGFLGQIAHCSAEKKKEYVLDQKNLKDLKPDTGTRERRHGNDD